MNTKTSLYAILAGAALLVVCIVLGAILGNTIGASQTGTQFDGLTNVLSSPTGVNSTSVFNWLVFCMFLIAGIISFAVCVAAAMLLPTYRDQQRVSRSA